MVTFTRHADGVGNIIQAAHINELQVAIEHDGASFANVLDYGATGNGTTDDTAAIQAAISAAVAAGGGIVFFPQGVYLCNTSTSAAGISWCLSIVGDNITLQGAPGAEIKTTTNNGLIFIGGNGKPGGAATWTTYWLQDVTKATLYAINPAAAGAKSITLTTAAQAGNFAVGDDIYLRTGQCIAASITEPDAELNIVKSANATTGVVVLRRPLAKPYAQEYYLSGTTGITSTSVTANLAPFGVSKATDRVLRNVALRGLKLTQTAATTDGMFQGCQIDRYEISDCDITASVSLMNHNIVHRPIWIRNRVEMTRSSVSATDYWFALGTGSGGGEIAGNDLTSNCDSFLHIHEGTYHTAVHHNRLAPVGGGTSTGGTISVRARAYGLRVHDNIVVTTKAVGAALLIDESCVGGGHVGPNEFITPNLDAPVGIGAAGWSVDSANLRGKGISFYNDAGGGLLVGGGAGPAGVMAVSNWVAPNQTSPVIGVIPWLAVITNIYVTVNVAFNGSVSNTLTVGYAGNQNVFATSMNVGAAAVLTVPFGYLTRVPLTAPRTVIAYYTSGGTAPTLGKALVIIEYVIVAREVA